MPGAPGLPSRYPARLAPLPAHAGNLVTSPDTVLTRMSLAFLSLGATHSLFPHLLCLSPPWSGLQSPTQTAVLPLPNLPATLSQSHLFRTQIWYYLTLALRPTGAPMLSRRRHGFTEASSLSCSGHSRELRPPLLKSPALPTPGRMGCSLGPTLSCPSLARPLGPA